jgi:hypothetical protein
MAVDRLLIIIMALAVAAMVLMILGQAFGQFDRVLKTVLRPPKERSGPEPAELRLIAPAALAAVIAALSLLLIVFLCSDASLSFPLLPR